MSNVVFPVLPGLMWNVVKKPIWSTAVHQTASGKETRLAYWTYPRWEFDLAYEFLRDDSNNELKTLAGFFLQRQGAYDSFLYTDPYDNTVNGQALATGDGYLKSFQLCRTFGGFVEPMQNINGTPTIQVNGVTTSAWVMNPTGMVTFTTAPLAGAVITANFSYYFRCRFLDDVAEFTNFMYQLWKLKKLSFVSVK